MTREELGSLVEGKTCFLSGPMTGIEHYNVCEFARANAILKELGARRVYNPALMWLNERSDISGERTHEDYMLDCLHELTRRDFTGKPTYQVMVQLQGWKESDGARCEHVTASCIGILCVEMTELEESE